MTWVCLSTGSFGAARSSWPAHAQVDDEHVAGVEGEQQVLALALGAGDLDALEPGRELRGRLAPHRPLAGDLHRLDLLADDLPLELAADGLYLGQLRHGPPRSRPSGTSVRCSDPPDGAVPAREASAARAAACSASFFDRPSPSPDGPAVRGGPCEEPLLVVGALVAQLVAGRRLEVPGRELLELGLVVGAAGADRLGLDAVGEGVEDDLACRLEASVEVDRTDQASMASDRIDSLARPPLASSPLPRRSASPTPRSPATAASVGRAHHRRPQLGERALGHLGVGAGRCGR